MTDTTDQQDFDGCRRACRIAGAHTRVWGECEHGVEPEPTVSISVVYTDPSDGYPSIGFDTYTVQQLADLIQPTVRSAAVARAAAHAIVHRHDEPKPAPAPVPSAPADRAALRDRIAEVIHDDLTNHKVRRDQGLLGIVPRLTDAVLSVLPVTVDRAAIARVRALHAPDENGGCLGCGSSFDPCPTIAVIDGPSRMAGEAQQPEAEARPGELKPWQLLAGHDEGPVPQTERLVGGRRLTRAEARQADTAGEQQ